MVAFYYNQAEMALLYTAAAVIGVLMSICPATAASFDCLEATLISDLTICSYEELSSLEEAYVNSYLTSISQGETSATMAKPIAARQMRERRQCGADPNCIKDALDRAITALGAISPDDSIFETEPASAASWNQLDPLSLEQLISLWDRMNESCRGGTTEMHISDCETREEVSDYLNRDRNWCYGREEEYAYEYKWHACALNSLGHSRQMVAGREWGTVIKLWGETTEESLITFREQAQRATGDVIVSLEGPGGLVDVGIEIAEIIQDRKFATVVEPGSQCYSICAIIFLSGPNIFMNRFGTVDVHSSYVMDQETGTAYRSFSGNAKISWILQRGGVPTDMIYYVQSGAPEFYLPISPKIARKMNLQFTEF